MYTLALAHFAKADPQLHAAILASELQLDEIEPHTDSTRYFEHLCEEIISQQLSGKVAEVIWQRFRLLFPEGVTAAAILQKDEQELRDAGLSWAKVRSIRDLAEKTVQGSIRYHEFNNLTEEEVIADLIQVKGIGRSTAEMFLIFRLGRADVFSLGDLGLKKSFQKIYRLPDGSELVARMIAQSKLWSPYRSYASRALWRLLDQKSIP